MIEIIPAILEKNLGNIQKKFKALKPYFKKVQIDIGDGRFVPNIFGCLDELASLRTSLALEAHLMVKEPWRYLDLLKNVDFRKITFHYEAFYNVPKKTRHFAINNLIKGIRKGIKKEIEEREERKGKDEIKVGMAINPETNPASIVQYLDRIDEALLLGVNPGKQGQRFNPEVLKKINFLKNFRKDIKIGVDGGVNNNNIKLVSEAGVDRVYVGSFLWQHKTLKEAIRELKNSSRHFAGR